MVNLDIQCEFGGEVEVGCKYEVLIRVCGLGPGGFESSLIGNASFTAFYPNLSHTSLLFMADQHRNDVYQPIQTFAQHWHSNWRRPTAVIQTLRMHDGFNDNDLAKQTFEKLMDYLDLLGMETIILNAADDSADNDLDRLRMRKMQSVYQDFGFSGMNGEGSHYMVKFRGRVETRNAA